MNGGERHVEGLRFAVDTGGTFTDLVVERPDGTLEFAKVPTTPSDPIAAVLDAFEKAAAGAQTDRRTLLSAGRVLIHATTHGINAILTGSAAKTAFLTTAGHPDILVFREGGRPKLFDFSVEFPQPYIPRSLTREVVGRIDASGRVAVPLDESAVRDLLRELDGHGVEAIAVCFLWATVNAIHEQRVGELIAEMLPGVPYTLSHALNPTLREYRRASAACIDASLKPTMSRYLGSLDERLQAAGFAGRLLMVTSTGGIAETRDVANAPILTLGSGPAMAPIGGRSYSKLEADASTAIVADAGGTSFDVTLVRRGTIPRTSETWIGERLLGHMTGFSSVDVKSIGAGGGSIAYVDRGGLLRVGPESAGAVPGPASYLRGGQRPTVTDAALILGYIDPGFFLGGAMRLDVEAASRAIETHIAEPLGISRYEAAAGVLEVTTQQMVSAIESILLQQGIDPTGAVLVSGGGAGGLNAVAIARRLGCSVVIIPPTAPTLSADGALMSDVVGEFGASGMATSSAFDYGRVNGVLDDLSARCRAFIARHGKDVQRHAIEYTCEARYPHQNWELEIPLAKPSFETSADVAAMVETFHRVHRDVFAISDDDSHVEVLVWRARASCIVREARPRRVVDTQTHGDSREDRLIYLAREGFTQARVVRLDALRPGEAVEGPAIVESDMTSVVVEAGATSVRSESGSLLLAPWAGRPTERPSSSYVGKQQVS